MANFWTLVNFLR